MKLISIEHLRQGMILSEDILNENGVVYLNIGTEIKERHIHLLQNLGVGFVYIKSTAPENDQTDIEEYLPKEKDYSQEFKKTLESFKNLYISVRLGKKVVIDEVKDSLEPLVSGILNNNNILGSLRRIEINDEYTFKHSINVSLISSMIGKWLGYSAKDLMDLSVASLLHDLGKCKIPIEILNKPAKLNDSEYEIIKGHSYYGFQLLGESGQLSSDALYGVLSHHERMDGSGYPSATNGYKIHEYARIIAIADTFDAMTSDRVYKSKLSPFIVAEEMLRETHNHLDVNITSLFLNNISKFYVGNVVRLNTGDIGEIVLVSKYNMTRPLIKVESKYFDLSKHYEYEIVEVIR